MTKDDPNMKPLPFVRRRGTSPIWHDWKPNSDDLLSHPAIADPGGEHCPRQCRKRVAEISLANTEQSSGVGQAGQAVSQMDQATQLNAALAQQLVQAVAVFQLAR